MRFQQVNGDGSVTDIPVTITEEIIETENNFKSLDVIAELGWQTHIAWERIIGEQPKKQWCDLSTDEVMRLEESVHWLMEHPTSSVAAQHDAWRARMASGGLINHEHPNMIPFDELPFSQQMKARLWRHIIFAVLG
jgi:hypothetical protein